MNSMDQGEDHAATGSVYLCIKQFNARLGDELSLKIGDKVEVLADDSEYNDGWYMGKNLLTEEVGLYPKGFTQILQNQRPEHPLLRSRSRRVMKGSKNNSPNTTTLSKIADSMQNMTLMSGNGSTNDTKGEDSLDGNDSIGTNGKPEFDRQVEQDVDTGFQKSSTSGLRSKFNDNYDGVNEKALDLSHEPRVGKSSVHKTMSDIDKALQELRTESDGGISAPPGTSANLYEQNTSNTSTPNQSANHHLRKISRDSLTENLDPAEAETWTPKQVSSYFAIILGFDMDVAGKFARHKITGAILFELDLTYLKELDIDSFGTRFEVYKEIEKLKQLSAKAKNGGNSNAKSAHKRDNNKNSIIQDLSDSEDIASPTDSKHSSPYKLHSFPNNSDEDTNNTTYSKSQTQLMPSANLVSSTPSKRDNTRDLQKGHERKRSQSMENIPSAYGDTTSPIAKRRSDLSFMSPRKAPEPPSASPLNQSYKFGGSPNLQNSPAEQGGLYQTRTNASSSNLGISGNSRPSSSIYEQSVNSHNRNASAASTKNHRRNSSYISGHRRNSSLFLFNKAANDGDKLSSKNLYKDETPKKEKRKSMIQSPTKSMFNNVDATPKSQRESEYFSLSPNKHFVDIDNVNLSPKKLRSMTYNLDEKPKKELEEKRSASETNQVSRFKTLRTASTQNFRNLKNLKKLKTSAFTEGIREITPDEAIKTATFSGWMAKKSGSTLGWRSRYFTLHGTRLLYFTSLRDKRERGLIDITAHKVLPVSTDNENAVANDKYIALYASSTGFGRYCFKLVPPAPGFRKGLTFTQPKTHYFAVDSQEEMRGWLKALMTSTIDIDDTVPVVSSCSTPTVTLNKAQELLAKAREETKLKDEELREKGFGRDGQNNELLDSYYSQFVNEFSNTSGENSPMIDSLDESTLSSAHNSAPKLTVDTSAKNYKGPSTPQVSQTGFASPYLLASGVFSPKLTNSGNTGSSSGTPKLSLNLNLRPNLDYYNDTQSSNSEITPKHPYSNGRIISGSSKKRNNSEKMLAYSNDGSGNHTFVIKPKK